MLCALFFSYFRQITITAEISILSHFKLIARARRNCFSTFFFFIFFLFLCIVFFTCFVFSSRVILYQKPVARAKFTSSLIPTNTLIAWVELRMWHRDDFLVNILSQYKMLCTLKMKIIINNTRVMIVQTIQFLFFLLYILTKRQVPRAFAGFVTWNLLIGYDVFVCVCVAWLSIWRQKKRLNYVA